MSVASLLLNYMATHVPLFIGCMSLKGRFFSRRALILVTLVSVFFMALEGRNLLETFSVASLGASSNFYITLGEFSHAFCKEGGDQVCK